MDTVPEPLVYYRQHGANMHRDIARMEADGRVLLDKAFADPLPEELARLERRAYSNLYRILAGSYWHARAPWNAACSAWPGTLATWRTWPAVSDGSCVGRAYPP